MLAGVIPALLALKNAGYRFVMVSNQDGLGSELYPHSTFEKVQKLLLQILNSQGIAFESILICPHLPKDACGCRKPQLGLVKEYLARSDWERSQSFVIGDRQSDLDLAQNMGIEAFRISTEESWTDLAAKLLTRPRIGHVLRKTKETDIAVSVNLDAPAPIHITTGLGFFDHMLEQLSYHGNYSAQISVKGDLHVDDHHTIEDTAIALGAALRQALGEKIGIGRYGFYLPMDESSAQVALDLSGRSAFRFEGTFTREQINGLATEMFPHFFKSFADALGATLHIKVEGSNTHHQLEAIFKAVAKSLAMAIKPSAATGIPSSKGIL